MRNIKAGDYMRDINRVQIQCAIIQIQARTIDALYSLLSQHKTVEGKEAKIPSDQTDVMEVQKEIIDSLFSELSKYISPEELDSLECIKEINEAAKLRKYLDGAY